MRIKDVYYKYEVENHKQPIKVNKMKRYNTNAEYLAAWNLKAKATESKEVLDLIVGINSDVAAMDGIKHDDSDIGEIMKAAYHKIARLKKASKTYYNDKNTGFNRIYHEWLEFYLARPYVIITRNRK
jgi:hypothetical protein